MKLAIMQPYFMPYIGYFQAIKAVDKYILYGNVSFIKKGWINRNQIAMKNGTLLSISVPLNHKSSNSLISDIQIDNQQKWQNKMLKAIYMNYKGAKAFDEVYQLLENILAVSHDRIFDLNVYSIISIARFLDIRTEIVCNNTIYDTLEDDLLLWEKGDYSVFPDLKKLQPIKKVARILQMCKMEKADTYVNAIGGQELYNKNEFREYNIDLKFLKTNDLFYKQFGNSYLPNLSIIDVMMHNGKENTLHLLNEYTLV